MIYPVISGFTGAEPPDAISPISWDHAYYHLQGYTIFTSYWAIFGESVLVTLVRVGFNPYWHLTVGGKYVYTFAEEDEQVVERRAAELLLNSSYLPSED